MRKFVKAFALAAGIFTILSTGTTVDAAQKNNRNQLYAEFLQRKYAINSGEAVTSFGLIDLDKDGQDELILNDGLTIATYYDPNNGLDEPRVRIN